MNHKRTPRLWKRLRNFLQRTVVPFLVAWPGQAVLHLLLFTCRFRVEGVHHLHQTACKEGCFLMLWHERLAIVAHVLLRQARHYYYTAVVSNSRDGEMLAAVARTYRHGGTIRVPHTARHRALKEMIGALEQGKIVLITPDGPRGPAHKAKQGVAYAARQTDAPIIPFSWTATRYWTLPTWDQTKIPKPFSTVRVRFGAPITVPKEDSLEQVCAQLEQTMMDTIAQDTV